MSISWHSKQVPIGVKDLMLTDFIVTTSQGEDVGIFDFDRVLQHIQRTRITQNEGECKTLRERETHNLIRACFYLEDVTSRETDLSGLVDVETLVLALHRLLMDNLYSHLTPGGSFSTERRLTFYKDTIHEYPRFDTQEDAWDTVQCVVDRYNALIDNIKIISDPSKRLLSVYKCGAWLLFKLVSLHPFSDGNGRLARLLCGYCLRIVTPFLSAVNGNEDFLDAIVNARKSGQPIELTRLLIHSSWTAWCTFTKRMRLCHGVDERADQSTTTT